ncbi:MAG TPA: response regulator [Chitinivibrionales bacterium]|nr:response regulator [Chitinivibrionales bacterium]
MLLVLIVEDNPLDADMLSRRLKRKGYDVIVAQDGETGVAMARERLPHCVIMDMGLPLLDGWEATRRLKASPITSAIPVIALTAHAMAEDKSRGLAAGCDGYETKPLEFDRLISIMESLISKGANA